jgi:hypothetical protein
MASTANVVRRWAGSTSACGTIVPSSFRKSMATGTSTVEGLAKSRSVLKNPPVAPSAKTNVCDTWPMR